MCTELKICNFCNVEFTYERVKKPKIYCSQKCAVAYHYKYVRDKGEMNKKVAKYYKKYPEKRFMSATKSSAKKRNLIFNLDEDWFSKRLKSGKCEITGLPMQSKPYQKDARGVRSFYSPSVDRIDNSQGYLKSNCRMVCWGFNLAKSTFTDRDLNALSLSVILSNLPKSCQPELMELLPSSVLASLPNGHPFPLPS